MRTEADKRTRKALPSINGRDPTSQLYRAAMRYVEANGGSIVVIGGIQTQEWDGPKSPKFTIGIKCMGRKPKYSTTEKPDANRG